MYILNFRLCKDIKELNGKSLYHALDVRQTRQNRNRKELRKFYVNSDLPRLLHELELHSLHPRHLETKEGITCHLNKVNCLPVSEERPSNFLLAVTPNSNPATLETFG